MILLPLALLAAVPPGEDVAHRADRLRTEELNRQAERAATRRERATRDAADDGYAAARRDYERRMAAWRRQVAACEDGDDRACRPD